MAADVTDVVAVTSLTSNSSVCRPGFYHSMCVYVSVLWKEYSVQGRFKTLQGVFVVLGPGWNAVMSGRMWQCGLWFGCGLVYVNHRDIVAVRG